MWQEGKKGNCKARSEEADSAGTEHGFPADPLASRAQQEGMYPIIPSANKDTDGAQGSSLK